MYKGNFIGDKEKMYDFTRLTKEEFMLSYSYLTYEEYDNTLAIYQQMLDDIRDVELKLYSFVEKLGSDSMLAIAWYIVHKYLQMCKDEDPKMKSEKLNHC